MPLVSKTFSEIITFARSTNATYYNAAGLLTLAPANTPRLDYNPSTLAAQGLLIEEQRVNLLTYSNYFDNAVWTKTRASVSANIIASPDGNTNADKLVEDTTAGSTHYLYYNNATISAATTYTFSVFLRAAERTFAAIEVGDGVVGADGAVIGINLTTGAIGTPFARGAGTNINATVSNAGNGWWRLSVTAQPGAAATTCDCLIYTATSIVSTGFPSTNGDGVSGIYLYGAQLEAGAFATSYAPSVNTFTSRASTGSYFDATGTLQSAAINVARNTYNPANLAAQPFLLLEESRANICLQSEDFSTTWTVAGTATITTNQLTSPAGTLTADLLTTPTGGPNRVQQAGTAVVSTTYAASVFVKVGNVNGLTLRVLFSGGTLVDTFADFIFSSATFSGINGAGVFSSQNCGNGWYRLTCVIASGNNTSWDFRVGGLIGTAQTGTTAYVWGAQIEAGAFPTSYIPTTTVALTRSADISSSAQATRAADVASVNTLSPWFNASESTLYTEYSSPVPNTVSASAVIAGYDDGTANNRFSNFYTSQSPTATAANQVTAGAANYTISAASGLTLSNIQKQATRFQAGSYASSANGAAAVTDAFASAPPTVTTLRFGLRPSGTQANIWLRRVTVYPRGLSNAELQTLAT